MHLEETFLPGRAQKCLKKEYLNLSDKIRCVLFSLLGFLSCTSKVGSKRSSESSVWELWKKKLRLTIKSSKRPLIIYITILTLETGLISAWSQLSRVLSSFASFLVSDLCVLAIFIVFGLSIITGLIVLVVIILYLPSSVLEEIEEKKLEFGFLGTLLLTISDILVLIGGMHGISVHYPQLISVAKVGILLAFACVITSWAMCSCLFKYGIKRRNVSHLLLATTIAIYSAITILYATAELLGLTFGLGIL